MKGRHEFSEPVRAKKHLGQHFLKDQQIASKIADTLSLEGEYSPEIISSFPTKKI